MRFGGSKTPLRLRVARTILYCQAAILALIAVFALEILVLGDAGTGFPLSGLVDQQTLTSSGATAFALTLLGVAVVLVVVEQQVAARGARARLVLVAAEVAISACLIGWVSSSVGTWLFGPACGAAVLILHYWPELHAYFFAADAVTPAPAAPLSPAPAWTPGGAEPTAGAGPVASGTPAPDTQPPAAAWPPTTSGPNSDAAARPHL
jgi:hypothetical protein